jgi:hypothetical protein
MNNLQEAYLAIYQEALDPEERALRRAEIADKKASRMDSKVAKKYSDSESKSAEREDKKSKGKHIHGMADSYNPEGEVVDENRMASRMEKMPSAPAKVGKATHSIKDLAPSKKPSPEERAKARKALGLGEAKQAFPHKKVDRQVYDAMDSGETAGDSGDAAKEKRDYDRADKMRSVAAKYGGKTRARVKEEFVDEKKDDSYLETDMNKRQKNNEKAIADMKKTKAHADMVKAARKHFEETDLEEKKGLWDNIHAKRKRGESPAKPGEKGYPKTLNVEELDQIIEGIRQARKNVGASKCWTGKKLGSPSTKMKGGKEVPNCVDEAVYGGEKKEPEDKRMVVTKADKTGNTKAYQNYKAGHKGYKAADHLGERALDPTEKAEKERLVTGMKKSAAGFKERYGKRAKEVMYATATKQAKERMDTSKSDRRYGVER